MLVFCYCLGSSADDYLAPGAVRSIGLTEFACLYICPYVSARTFQISCIKTVQIFRTCCPWHGWCFYDDSDVMYF